MQRIGSYAERERIMARKQATAQGAAEADKGTTTKKARSPKQTKPEKDKKLSALDAAAKLLAETGEPMNCQDMIKGMSEKGYWTSPGGQTPHATLYSAISRELKTKGAEARFRKAERGKFAANPAK
jgi:hypothetical protein